MAKGKPQIDPRSWDAVHIPDWMKDYASSMGYRKMTAVQASCLPQFLEKGADVVVEVCQQLLPHVAAPRLEQSPSSALDRFFGASC